MHDRGKQRSNRNKLQSPAVERCLTTQVCAGPFYFSLKTIQQQQYRRAVQPQI